MVVRLKILSLVLKLFAKLPIKPANKPTEGLAIAGVALYLGEYGIGYFNIRITEDLVKKLGKRMPYGLGPENTAYIQVIHKKSIYEVWCVYLDKSKRVKVAEYNSLPEWVKRVKYD